MGKAWFYEMLIPSSYQQGIMPQHDGSQLGKSQILNLVPTYRMTRLNFYFCKFGTNNYFTGLHEILSALSHDITKTS
jgi:hypothetical protein